MHPRFTLSLVLAGLLWLVSPAAARAAVPEGVWWNEAHTVQVQVEDCGGSLCAHIVWMAEPLDADGQPKRDRRNPDPTLRDRPILGLQVLEGLAPRANRPGTWRGGTAYDATHGRTYRCNAVQVGPDEVRVRGYIGIALFGRTERWTRVQPDGGSAAE